MKTMPHTFESVVPWLLWLGVRRLVADSRQVQPGDAFVAWPGREVDARIYMDAAVKAGAVACVIEHEDCDAWDVPTTIPVASVRQLKKSAGRIASGFYDRPSRALQVVAITGTNGKTSSAWWCAQWLAELHEPVSLIGTLGAGSPTRGLVPTGLTTPDPLTVQALLHRFVQQGQQVCVMEASSIGLVEGRLNGTHIDVAIFTNFSQDHLDYHPTMADYWAAKRALFDWPGLRAAVVNIDDEAGKALAHELVTHRPELLVWTVSLQPNAVSPAPHHLCIVKDQWTPTGLFATIEERSTAREAAAQGVAEPLTQQAAAAFNVVGQYNLSNLLCGLAVVRLRGHSLAAAVQVGRSLTAVPGRMQPAWGEAPPGLPLVLVDYAHTPDAIETALKALRPLAQHRGGQLWCVLGCGGDRDRTKRPLMAAAAEREAQHVILTSDNPRSEDPVAIVQAMQQGLCAPQAVHTDIDRAAAIEWAVQRAQAHDVVLIAGKGHEDIQEIGGVKKPFSDVRVARQAMQSRTSRPFAHPAPPSGADNAGSTP